MKADMETRLRWIDERTLPLAEEHIEAGDHDLAMEEIAPTVIELDRLEKQAKANLKWIGELQREVKTLRREARGGL